MKNFLGYIRVVAMAAVAFGLGCLDASAQVTANRTVTCEMPAVVAANTTSNVTSTAVSLRQGKGLSFIPRFKATGASISNAVFRFQVSADGGTTYTTTTPLSYTAVQTGTTEVVGYALFPPTTVNNCTHIKLVSIQTDHGTQALTNMSGIYAFSE